LATRLEDHDDRWLGAVVLDAVRQSGQGAGGFTR
jgi:hypothetical protein